MSEQLEIKGLKSVVVSCDLPTMERIQRYPGPPPYEKGSSTSKAAADDIKSHVPKLRSLVLGYIQEHGPCTDEKIQRGLGIEGSTERPRRRELEKMGLIAKVDDCGITQSGRRATRWGIKK